MLNHTSDILQSLAQGIEETVDRSEGTIETIETTVVAGTEELVLSPTDHATKVQPHEDMVDERTDQLDVVEADEDVKKQVLSISVESDAHAGADGEAAKQQSRDEMVEKMQEIEEVVGQDSLAPSLRDEESLKLGKEIFFHRNGDAKYCGWDNLRWMAYSGTRKIDFVGSVYRFIPGRRNLFWSGDEYQERVLAIYSEPHLILILRPPENMSQVLEILDLPEGATVDNADDVRQSYLIVESVVDPKTCKLKLSPLTTVTSVLPDVSKDDCRRQSCFELLNPTESIALSAVRLRKGAERALTSFTDSGAYLETTSTEHVLQKSICDAHCPVQLQDVPHDLSWKHQIILGTLHSHVVLGSQLTLDMALLAAKALSKAGDSDYLEPRVIDVVDESGRTPLHYACTSRFSSAVASLVKAGANVDIRVEPFNMTPCHLCALNLDSKSLQSILSVNRRPNVADSWGRTPMYLATMDGRSVGQSKNPSALESCLSILEAYGGQLDVPFGFQHPISALAATWSHEELAVVLRHVSYRYPLVLPNGEDKQRIGISLSALYQYPVHSCLIALRKNITAAAYGVKDCEIVSSVEKSVST